MIIGGMRERITLQRLAESRHTNSGEAQETVTEELTVWARFKALSGKEVFEAGREVARSGGMFEVRYRTGIKALSWRIKDWEDRIWDIVSEPKEINRKQGLNIAVELRE